MFSDRLSVGLSVRPLITMSRDTISLYLVSARISLKPAADIHHHQTN